MLFEEYAAQLAHDLGFQRFDHELDNIPAVYGPPHGRLLLAASGDVWIACGAVRPQSEAGVCELKRMYVQPDYRRRGIAERMATALLDWAQAAGYRTARLDTLDHMTPARRLYESLGFRNRDAYYHNPIPGAVYYERVLGPDLPKE